MWLKFWGHAQYDPILCDTDQSFVNVVPVIETPTKNRQDTAEAWTLDFLDAWTLPASVHRVQESSVYPFDRLAACPLWPLMLHERTTWTVDKGMRETQAIAAKPRFL